MNTITKQRLKELAKLNQKKYRDSEQKVIVEGFRLIEQLVQNAIEIEEFYLAEQDVPPSLINYKANFFRLEKWQLEKLTSTLHPQNIAALVPIKSKKIIRKDLLLYLDNISDPGNLGAIFRTATAADIDGIILSPDCCEVFNPKVIRASLGSVFTIPHEFRDHDWLRNQDAAVIAASVNAALDLYKFKIPAGKKILVLGSEAEGIRSEILACSDFRVQIPISGRIESLNAAVAAGIFLFHLKNAG